MWIVACRAPRIGRGEVSRDTRHEIRLDVAHRAERRLRDSLKVRLRGDVGVVAHAALAQSRGTVVPRLGDGLVAVAAQALNLVGEKRLGLL